MGCSVLLSTATVQANSFRITRDLDEDGRVESVVVDSTQKKQLAIYRGKVLLWSGVTRRVRPWKLVIADVDGDGKQDIVMGTIKATRYFPQPHRTLSIYGWNGREALPKWRGSALSRPFSDFAFSNVDNDATVELIALEYRHGGRRSVGIYSWNSFGFTQQAEAGNWRTAKLLPSTMAAPGAIALLADGRKIVLSKHALQHAIHSTSQKEPQ